MVEGKLLYMSFMICFRNKDDEQNEYPVLKHPTEILEKSRRKHLLDAVNASVAATKNDAKTERKNSTQYGKI
jgi:hypothetical protein